MAKKKQKANRKPSQVYKLYEKDGDKVKKKSNFCPKCGQGVFLAKHKNRISCGKCGYTEFQK